SLSETDFDQLHGSWFQAFKSLPTGVVIQKQDVYTKSSYSADDLPKTSFLQKATYDYFKGRRYLKHHSYLLFVLPMTKGFKASKYTNPFGKIDNRTPGLMNQQVEDFLQSVGDVVSYLNNSRKLQLLRLNESAILQLTESYFNGFNKGFDTDILLGKNGISIGDHHFDVMALNSELCFGELLQSSKLNERFSSDDFKFHQGFIDGLGLALNENHIVNHIIYMDDKHRWRKLLEKKVEELNKSSNFGTQNLVVLKKIKDVLDRI